MKQTFSEEFVASRITRGNIIFPKRIEINEKQITFVTPGVFNTIKKSIYINNIAEVELVYNRLGFCAIKVIKKFGGSEFLNGFRALDADRIKSIIDELIGEC